jgi:integrase
VLPSSSSASTSEPKPPAKKYTVSLYQHEWTIYPCADGPYTSYKVADYGADGRRRFKTFSSQAKAEAYARGLIRDRYGSVEKIFMSGQEKEDWHKAVTILKERGIKSPLPRVAHLFAEAAESAGGEDLVVEAGRYYKKKHERVCIPVQIGGLADAFVEILKGLGRSKRYVQSMKHYLGSFAETVGRSTTTDHLTREVLQQFFTDLNLSARSKENFASSLRTFFEHAKSKRHLPADWDEIDHVDLPTVKKGKIPNFDAEDLKKLFAAATDEFIPCLALGAFAGIRPAEIERLDWVHIRLKADKLQDRIINLDADVTKTNSRRSIPIHKTLSQWLEPHWKRGGPVWTGSHDRYYRVQLQIAKKAKVKWGHDALRHTCIT